MVLWGMQPASSMASMQKKTLFLSVYNYILWKFGLNVKQFFLQSCAISCACYISIQNLLSVHFRLSLSLHYILAAVKGGHKHALVVARLEKHRNVSQFWSLGLRCVALRTLWEIIEFNLNEIKQHQHIQRQAETVQHISHFPFHFLKTFTRTDALLLFHYAVSSTFDSTCSLGRV